MLNLFDLEMGEPIKNNNDIKKENKENKSERIKKKRELLFKYMNNPNSTNEDFEKIIKEYPAEDTFTVNEALDYAYNNPYMFIYLNKILNTNYGLFFDKNIGAQILKELKNNNPYNVVYQKPKYIGVNNPYYNQGISNSIFNQIWKTLRKKNVELNENDKWLLPYIYTIDELKEEVGFIDDSDKYNEDNSNIVLNFNKPYTKGELYTYWNNLTTLYNYSDINVLGNITVNNMNDKLSNILLIFVTLMPHIDDLQSKIIFINKEDKVNIFDKYISFIPDEKYICINICNNIANDKEIYKNCIINIFDRILSLLPKESILVPVNEFTYRNIFGCISNNDYYKYNNHLIINSVINNDVSMIKDIINNSKFKRPSVKRANNFKTENIIININNIDNNILPKVNNNIIDNIENIKLDDLTETSSTITHNNTKEDNSNVLYEPEIINESFNNIDYQYSEKKIKYNELQSILNDLNEYNVIYCSKKLYKSKYASTFDKKGTPYITLRNGIDKRIYYLDIEETIGYTTNPNCFLEENINNLNIIDNVNSYNSKQIINQLKSENSNISFYNTDFLHSTQILTKIRKSFNYKEGNNKPRIAILDFETEKDAIKVKPNNSTINAKCRLFSLLDSLTNTAYCGIIIDPEHHNNDVINKLQNIKEHQGYNVVIKLFNNEKDLWNYLIQLLIELDPDILTGWNIEIFDLVYAIVRCNTLGIKFRNKYSDFMFVNMNNKNITVMVDGMVILDYLKLYRASQTKKKENYKLEYICQLELGKGKRAMVVDDHDEMYWNHLIEYTLYNIEDSARVFELDNKTKYLDFKYELMNVCNISWDDIFAQTRLIDGLIYEYSLFKNHSFIKAKENNYNNNDDDDENNEEELSKNIKLELINELQSFINENNIDTIDNNKISLRNYIDNTRLEIYKYIEKNKNNKSKNKGYEGAVVLKTQSGLYDIIADLDASQMYPRLMIRSNIFVDTLCAVIAYDNEVMAEKWIYDNENFPSEIPLKFFNSNDKMAIFTKEQFREYLKDKILTPFGTIFWKPSVKRSLVSNILIDLIANRLKYKNLMAEAEGKYGKLKEIKGENDPEVIKYKQLTSRYKNIQTSYKYLINAIYGVMGMINYRLANSYCAASITASGRELTRIETHFASLYIDEMIKEKKIDVEFEKISLKFKTLKGFEDIENRRNAIYGDTDSSMFLICRVVNELYGKDLNEDQIIKYALSVIERVSQFINKYIIKYVLTMKNIDFNDEDSKFNYEYKKEWVAKKMMLGSNKKQYAMHLIYSDGEKVDEIEIKGMSTIKSDTPRFTREFLNDITYYILKEYDINNTKESNKNLIMKYNQAIEKAYYLAEIGSVNIGRPVSITQDLNDYETIQSSIRGMLLYDIFYDYEFIAGSKGYQFDIEKINWENTKFKSPEKVKEIFNNKYHNYKWFNKVMKTMTDELLFGSITVPTDIEKLDTSIFIIDKKTLKESIIKKKVEKIMEIVGIQYFDKDDIEKEQKKVSKNTIDIGNFLSFASQDEEFDLTI